MRYTIKKCRKNDMFELNILQYYKRVNIIEYFVEYAKSSIQCMLGYHKLNIF